MLEASYQDIEMIIICTILNPVLQAIAAALIDLLRPPDNNVSSPRLNVGPHSDLSLMSILQKKPESASGTILFRLDAMCITESGAALR